MSIFDNRFSDAFEVESAEVAEEKMMDCIEDGLFAFMHPKTLIILNYPQSSSIILNHLKSS